MSSSTGTEQPPVDVVEVGDIILHIRHTTATAAHRAAFRVSTTSLSAQSKYFERLLQAGRFGEGTEVQNTLAALLQRHGSISQAPVEALPALNIDDIGRISAVKSIEPLLRDFFTILSGQDLQTVPPVSNLANLAAVADRFDALPAVTQFVRRKKYIRSLEAKTTSKQEAALTEEKMRQRVLIGLLLDHPPWVDKYTARLIIKGLAYREPDLDAALWWMLPGRLEEELIFRRDSVLRTIQDLQSHFLTAYSSRERQCRLGYDSSSECDSFQLGEMVRFFLRIGTLHLQGALLPEADEEAEFEGDLTQLIDRLRQVPEYQIDRNHSHCGLRTRVVPLLDLITTALVSIGVCGECWHSDKHQHAWTEVSRPAAWVREQHGNPGAVAHHEDRHKIVRRFFTAKERTWS